jgi:hypothetical protein
MHSAAAPLPPWRIRFPDWKQFHLPHYLAAGGMALVLLGWAWSSFVPLSWSATAADTAATAGTAFADSVALGQAPVNPEDSATDSEEGVRPSSAPVISGGVEDSSDIQPGSSGASSIAADGAPPTSLLSNGSSLEDQLQALRSAELRESYPVEPSPAGVSIAPPAPPGAVNPHQ